MDDTDQPQIDFVGGRDHSDGKLYSDEKAKSVYRSTSVNFPAFARAR